MGRWHIRSGRGDEADKGTVGLAGKQAVITEIEFIEVFTGSDC